MNRTAQYAQQFRELFDGKWVAGTNFKEQLSEMGWKEATTQVGSLNTIAELTFHVNYYVAGCSQALEGGPLEIRDKFSFDLPPIESEQDWEKLKSQMWKDADRFSQAIENLPEEKLADAFVDEKYGPYDRNILAIIEHCYYHLGQVVMIKKLLEQG